MEFLDGFSERSNAILNRAKEIATEDGCSAIYTIHAILALYEKPDIAEKLRLVTGVSAQEFTGAYMNLVENQKIKTSREPVELSIRQNTHREWTSCLNELYDIHKRLRVEIDLNELMRSIISNNTYAHELYIALGVPEQTLKQLTLIEYRYLPLSQFCKNLNLAVSEPNAGLLVGRDSDVQKVIETLGRRVKNNPLLIGDAGVGKTTTLEYIEYQDAINYENNKKIPVIISLITVEENEPIEKLIIRKLEMEENDDNIEIVNYLIEKGRLNIYLDGVNEISISDYNLKRDFLNELEKFVTEEKNKNTKIIVTDRDNSEVSVLNNVDTFLIQGMTENDIDAFIEGNAIPEKAEEVKEAIKENKEFSEMIVNPIMLKDLITIIECGKPIPEDIEELSEVYLETIINREIDEKKDQLASYINGALTYMVKQAITTKDGKEIDWTSNAPTSYFKVIDIFYDYAKENNIDLEKFDAERLLSLIKKMGILKEVEFQKYAFSDEKFFHIYYYNAISN